MKKRIDRTMIITTLVCLLPVLAAALLYDKLPDLVPIHFNAAGEADGYASKAVGAFAIPVFMAAINLIVQFALNNDPKKANMSKMLLLISKCIIPVLSIVVGVITLCAAMGTPVPVQTILPVLMGVMFIAIGNYMPKTKQNYTMGIKLPWTLNSEENWNKTHRLAGYLWVIGGVLMVIGTLLDPEFWPPLFFAVIVVMVFIPMIYSYLLYKKGI